MLKNERYFHIQTKINTKILRIKDDPNRKIPEHEIIKISLIAKYMKTIKAISLLDLNGFFEDAKILLRSLFEIAIILLYCDLDSTRYYRYKEYQFITLNNYLSILDEDDKKKIVENGIERIEKKVLKFKEKYLNNGFKKNELYTWNGISFHNTVNEVIKQYNDDELDTYYNVIYKLNCEFTHSDYNSIINSYLYYDSTFSSVTINTNPEKNINYVDIVNHVEAITDKLLSYIK